MQLHGGHIEARSEGPGRGSEFVVRLPILAEVPRIAPASSSAHVLATPLPPHRILVVDDAAAAAFVLGKLLEKMGQQVRIVHDAAGALDQVQRERPDVVISDIGMPGMDGYELAARLRQLPQMADVVLVALTGYGQESDRQRACEAGFDHHLVKPVSLEALRNLLASLPATAPTAASQASPAR